MSPNITKQTIQNTTPPVDLSGYVDFQVGAQYWQTTPGIIHAIKSRYVAGIARKKWSMEGEPDPKAPDFPVPVADGISGSLCRVGGTRSPQCYNWQLVRHRVPARSIFRYATDELGLRIKPLPVVEKIIEVEKIVYREVPLILTFEKREILGYALARELQTTLDYLRRVHLDDPHSAIEWVGRNRTIRELMAEFEVDVPVGDPAWVMRRVDVPPTDEDGQTKLFETKEDKKDAV